MKTKNCFTLKRNCIINNLVLFLVSYLLIFYVAQLAMGFSAFTHGVPIRIYTSLIDFNSVSTAATDSIWTSADNVIEVFGMPIMALSLLGLISILLLTKWKTDKLQIRRFLFWLFICSFVRLGSNFVTGHLFHLWNINLVTDFMGITYPSFLMKYLFVFVILILVFAGFYWSASLLKYIVNPYSGNFKKDLAASVIIPVTLGAILLNLYFLPYNPMFTWTEVFSTVFCLIGLVFISVPTVLKRYKFVVEHESELIDDRKLNVGLLVIGSLSMIAIKFFFDKGVLILTSPYRNYFVENLIFIACGVILLLFVLWLYFEYRIKKKRERAKIQETLDEIEGVESGISEEQWGVKKYDMSKYEIRDKN